MKKKIVVCLILGCMLLTGCSGSEKSNDSSNDSKTSQITNEAAETKKSETEEAKSTESGEVAKSLEISDRDIKAGNSSANYTKDAFVCETESGVYYIDEKNNLIYSENGKDKKIQKNVYGGLNYYNKDLYFVENANSHLCVLKSGESKAQEVLTEEVNSPIVFEDGILYTDSSSNLMFKAWDSKDSEKIFDGQIVWLNYYKGNIIASNLKDSENANILSYNLETKEQTCIVNYSLFPIVYDNNLYYQGKDASTHKINLDTLEDSVVVATWSQGYTRVGENEFYFVGDSVYQNPSGEQIYNNSKCTVKEIWNLKDVLFIKINEQGTDKILKYDTKSKKLIKGN